MKHIRLTLSLFILLGCAVLPMRAVDGNGIAYRGDTIAPSYLKGIYAAFFCSVDNAGTTTWGAGHQLRLRDEQGQLVATASIAGVSPGLGTGGTFNFWFPNVAGTHHYTVQAWEEGVGAFGEVHPVDLVIIDHYDAVNDFRLDRYFMFRSDTRFFFSVQVTNTGTRYWSDNHFLVLQDAAGNDRDTVSATGVPSGYTRAPNFEIPLPRNPGIYSFRICGKETGVGYFGLSEPMTLTLHPKPEMDFNADTQGDLLWYNPGTGAYRIWQMNPWGMLNSVAYTPEPGSVVCATRDFDGDGKSDLLWRDENTGEVELWRMNGNAPAGVYPIYNGGLTWAPVRFGDFNGDGKADILWENSATHGYAIWLMDGRDVIGSGELGAVDGWTATAVKDFGGDGKTDILWRNSSSGAVVLWEMDGVTVVRSSWLYNGGLGWRPVKFAEFNADGKTDILWQNTADGMHAIWLMDGSSIIGSAAYGSGDWTAVATEDFDGDVKADVLWRNSSTGALVLWLMNGTVVAADGWIYSGGPAWEPVRFTDLNWEGKSDIIWRNETTGTHALWRMDGFSVVYSSEFDAGAGWENW